MNGLVGTSGAGHSMSAYSALGQVIEMMIHAKWCGFGLTDQDIDGVPAIIPDGYNEGMTIKIPGAEKELYYLERDIRRLNKRYFERLMKLAEGRCLICGEDRGGQARFCLCCVERMKGIET